MFWKRKFLKKGVRGAAKNSIHGFLGIVMACVVLSGILGIAPQAYAVQGVSVSARAAILINADTGDVLFAKNENERLAMASTTKIMTSLLVLEKAAVSNPEVEMTDEMVRVEGSSMGLKAGYRLHLRDLAVGMLMVSGNDAANAAAIAVAGSKDAFADLMNAKAAELGMQDTHFVTPSGLDADEHYSTAKDMAALGAAAIRNDDFRSICSQTQMGVEFINPDQKVRLSNHNRLLNLYQGCIGVKTGFTKKAGRCLVSAAERSGVRLVAVTLNAPDDWNDHQKMYDYGFSALTAYPIDERESRFSVSVVGGTGEEVSVAGRAEEPLVLAADQVSQIQRIVELPRFLYAPVGEGQVVGQIRYEINGKTRKTVLLTAQGSVEAAPIQKSWFHRMWDWICGWFS